MPGLGPAGAYIAGWNKADNTEKDRILEEMRVLAGTARDVTAARASQSTTRREEELFPELFKGQQFRNVGTDIANQLAQERLTVSRATGPSRIKLEQLQVDAATIAYERGEIELTEYINALERAKGARAGVERRTGVSPEELGLLGKSVPGLQAAASIQGDVFNKQAQLQGVQADFGRKYLQAKIDQGVPVQQVQLELQKLQSELYLINTQAWLNLMQPYIKTLSRPGSSPAEKLDAKRKAQDAAIKEIKAAIDSYIALTTAITLKQAQELGFDPAFITMLNPKAGDIDDARIRLEGHIQFLKNRLQQTGINYDAFAAVNISEGQPPISPESLLYGIQLDRAQTDVFGGQIPGQTQFPVQPPVAPGSPIIGEGLITPEGPAPEKFTVPEGWESLNIDKILKAYGNLGGTSP